jgi:hypothetical protein
MYPYMSLFHDILGAQLSGFIVICHWHAYHATQWLDCLAYKSTYKGWL